MLEVRFDDLEDAFGFVNSGSPMENLAYISLDTGKIYWVSDVIPAEGDIPEDLDDSDRYLVLPHAKELGLGDLPLRFTDERLPGRYQEVASIFRRSGAYRRFKELLASLGRLEEWYQFEDQEEEKALREWCSENDIRIVEKPPAAAQ
jgi:Uncharacterised protein family (UPF0158)